LVNLDGIRRLKVVVDAGNGMAGHTVPSVLGPLNVEVVGLFLELDGSFPNHQPNPLAPENLVDAQKAVIEHGADLALVFDGDADRCFVIDERGEVVSPSTVTALIAAAELHREPGSTIVINTITSRSVAEVVAENGGTLVTSKVGHTYVKALMAEHGAIFGGEHSAHYYFRDFWGADTGMLAGLHVLGLLGHGDVPLSKLVRQYERYVSSGEINSTVADAPAKVAEVRAAFPDADFDELDGLTARLADGSWFNLRTSNTEPLLRLNVEATKPDRMAALRDDVLAIVRG
jgi:phosphomannomutase